jgi:hypothetical protein
MLAGILPKFFNFGQGSNAFTERFLASGTRDPRRLLHVAPPGSKIYCSPLSVKTLSPEILAGMNLTAEQTYIASFEGVCLTALYFRLERCPSFHYLTEFMNKRPPIKKPQAKIQTVKKQIPGAPLTESRSS